MSQKLRALGIMNGTSLDAIDYSVAECGPNLEDLKFVAHRQFAIPLALRKRLLAAAMDELTTYELSILHYDLGRTYAEQVKKLQRDWQFDMVGLHGQTVHHEGGKATLQIGHPGFLQTICQKPVYFDFRAADIVAGGQGAPFAPFFHRLIAPTDAETLAFHNLGGISNLTYLRHGKVLAFDTGPANILLDAWIQKRKRKPFDLDGKAASRGLPQPKVVNHFLKFAYFHKKPPKSTGREAFNLNFIEKKSGPAWKSLSFEDQMATLSELSALSIAKAYQQLPELPKTIYFYGGGVANKDLMARLRFHLQGPEFLDTDALGWPSQALESSAFAAFALARYQNISVHIPQVTGAKKTVNLGSLYF